ncbi:MAG: hypothetical protein ACJ8BW_28530 [Ktedonobacteraceae bacterium]
MSHLIVKTYEEARRAVEQLGILPLSRFIPAHPSLDSITEPATWHTGAATDPWHWRDRFASEGIAAYGRFIGSRPILIAREVFPLVKCLLASLQTVQERYAAGLLARSTVQIYQIIQDNQGIEVRALRKLAGMQEKAGKHAFDHALIDLQNTADIVISGMAEYRNDQGNTSGWNGTCYMLAERWMEEHGIKILQLSPADAKTQLFAWLKPHWEEEAVLYLQKKLTLFPHNPEMREILMSSI